MQQAWRLPHDTASVGAARRMVVGLVGPELDDAVQVTSELVANAVEHGSGDVRLVVNDSASRIRIEVSSEATSDPVPRAPQPLDTFGRGLVIVGRLAANWGWTREGDLVTVWADVAREDA